MRHLLVSFTLLLTCGNVYAEIVPPIKPCEGTQFELRVCADKNLIASDAKIREVLPSELAKRWGEVTGEVCEERWQIFREGSIYPMMLLKCNDNLNRTLLKEFRKFGN